MRYGTGWFWQQYDHNHAALVPLSTAYPCPSITWHHAETCAVDRTSGFGCTCTTTEKEMRDAVKAQAKEVNEREWTVHEMR